MTFPRINLHIHSNFSDGKNSIQQIVEGALKSKLNYIAITDHYTNSWKKWVSNLKDDNKISEYLDEITFCQKYLFNNNKNLILQKGLEVDLGSSDQFIKKIQPSEFDLILFEYLETVEGIAFVRNIINSWKNLSKAIINFPILGLAHFDPSYFIHGSIDILINFLKKFKIYFEFNPRYPRFYSRQYELFFEKIKDNNIPVAIGSDSHSVASIDNLEEPLEMIKYYNLEPNFQILIDTLEIRNKF
ncbi:hypothetical protein LCGC14_2462650 [marine sediment metagenome]|uniref:Polymerase/histidinol phosphatase N-terminal domain-containing protein n=1 Tax=marine sediment metagenome TaxID=412755 RepID=A0A0F9BCV1_9ZZZZ